MFVKYSRGEKMTEEQAPTAQQPQNNAAQRTKKKKFFQKQGLPQANQQPQQK